MSQGGDKPGDAQLLLNLGCGSQRPAGWLNVDSSPGIWLARHARLAAVLRRLLPARLLPSGDWAADCVSADLTRPLPWPDASADAVYSSHLFEHLTREEGARLLAECARVLRPGGHVRIIVPDLERVVEDYRRALASEPAAAASRFHHDTGYFDVRPPRSLSELLAFRIRSKNNHAFLYDEPALAAALMEAGFTRVERRACGESAIPGIDAIDLPDRFAGALCLEAERP